MHTLLLILSSLFRYLGLEIPMAGKQVSLSLCVNGLVPLPASARTLGRATEFLSDGVDLTDFIHLRNYTSS